MRLAGRGANILAMTASPSAGLITAGQFLHMPENRGAELVDGHAVEKSTGGESSWIGGELLVRIANFIRGKRLGHVFGAENGVAIWPGRPKLVRKPDVSFVRHGRLPGDGVPKGWQVVVPDLVVEVVSPNDQVDEFERKLAEYREAGVPLSWVIYPGTRAAQVLTPTRRFDVFPDGSLEGGDVLPGFSCSLQELFAVLDSLD
jgi:Uma2 family endonuclease